MEKAMASVTPFLDACELSIATDLTFIPHGGAIESLCGWRYTQIYSVLGVRVFVIPIISG